jgi:D-alanine-D-alanine ligase
MRVAFLYNEGAEDPSGTAEDAVPAASPLVAALRRLGHNVTPIACTLDLAALQRELDLVEPDAAFNRVESLGGSDAMMAAVTLLLDSGGIPYTGCRTASLLSTASKLNVKRRLAVAGLPTPAWIGLDGRLTAADVETPDPELHVETRGSKYIVKSVFEHASFEIDDTSVIEPADCGDIVRLLEKRTAEAGRPVFAERFIEGREFNLSLLGRPAAGDGARRAAPVVLPAAEIDFSAFPAGKPRIVGHGAKWNSSSFEFRHTPRRFDFPPRDAPLLARLKELAVRCWELFELSGYARVDFRCDNAGRPWILEINANPCLAPASGFAAALERAGIDYDEGIRRILDAALPLPTLPANSGARQRPLTVG